MTISSIRLNKKRFILTILNYFIITKIALRSIELGFKKL